jgi:hypothetical protein
MPPAKRSRSADPRGQTGIWLSALYLAGMVSLIEPELRWPWGAAAFGLAAFKPHLGLLIPLTLLLSRQWAAFAMATATFIVFALASVLVFGVDLWWGFLESAGGTLELLGASRSATCRWRRCSVASPTRTSSASSRNRGSPTPLFM